MRSKAAKDQPRPLWRRLLLSPWGLLVVGLGGFGLLYLGAREDLMLAQAYPVAFALFQAIGFPVLLWMRARGDFFEMVLTLRFKWLWLPDDESDGWLISWLIVLLVGLVLGVLLALTHGPAMMPWAPA